MRSFMMKAVSAALTVWLASGPASAREDFCYKPRTQQIDKKATKAYREFAKKQNEKLMQNLSGVWFLRTDSPSTGQISLLWQTFEPNGLYSYYNEVCTAQCPFGPTIVNGVGVYTLRGDAKGFLGSKIVSDTGSLDHACLSLNGRLTNNRNTWVVPGLPGTPDGVLQRVRQ